MLIILRKRKDLKIHDIKICVFIEKEMEGKGKASSPDTNGTTWKIVSHHRLTRVIGRLVTRPLAISGEHEKPSELMNYVS